MTNASVYVYDSLEDYMVLYPKGQDVIVENHLSAIFIDKKTIALVSDNSKGRAGYRPDLSKSLVYFDGGEAEWDKHIKKHKRDFEHVVEVIVKGSAIFFIGQEIQKVLAVAKSYGDVKNGHAKGYILYDTSVPRINVIMNPITSESS